MSKRPTKATLIELFALFSVVAPFVGFGLTELLGNGVYFIAGAGTFCMWMMLVPLFFLGTYKQRIANRRANTDPDSTSSEVRHSSES